MLYLREHLMQKEIAVKVGVSANTVSNWVKKGKWEEHKAGLTITREAQLANLYRQVAEMNETIAGRKKGERFASPSEADALSKLSAAIGKLEGDTGISDIISVGIRFVNWIRPVDMEKAKEFTGLWDAFIKDSL